MSSRLVTLMVLVAAMVPLMWLGVFLGSSGETSSIGTAYAPISVTPPPLTTSTTLLPRPTATSQSHGGSFFGIDSTLFAGILTMVGSIIGGAIGAIILGRYSLHIFKKTSTHERELVDKQHELAMELEQKKQDYAIALLNLQQQYAENPLKQQGPDNIIPLQNEKHDDKAHIDKEKVFETEYRKKLPLELNLIQTQIPYMKYPLDLEKLYIHRHVHSGVILSYSSNAAVHDPIVLLRTAQRSLERRINDAPELNKLISNKRSILLGNPGTGKTTLLKYLALQLVGGNKNSDASLGPDLPIYVDLQEFADSDAQNLFDFISSKWKKDYDFPNASTYLEKKLKEGKVLLLLDGCDTRVMGETVDKAKHKRVRDAINDQVSKYQNSPTIVTARKADYLLGGSTKLFLIPWEIEDLCPEDIRGLVSKWVEHYPDPHKPINDAELNVKLEFNPRIQSLAANPRLLTEALMMMYERETLFLPNWRIELYEHCKRSLFGTAHISSDGPHDDKPNFQPAEKEQLLESVAWYLHTNGFHSSSKDDLLRGIAQLSPGGSVERYREVLHEIIATSGLIRQQTLNDYSFLCLTLQEYFAARYVEDHHELEEALLAECCNPWWEEVILLYASFPEKGDWLLRKIGDVESDEAKDDFFHTNLLIGARYFAACSAPPVSQIQSKIKIITRLLATLANTRDLGAQEQITHALADIGKAKVKKEQLPVLSPASEEYMHITAAREVLGDRQVSVALLPLLSDPQIEPEVRRKIADWDQDKKDLKAKSVKELFPREKSNTCLCISRTLALSGERTLARRLVKLLSYKKINPHIGGSFAKALGMLGELSVIPDLIKLLSNPEIHIYIRWNSVKALAELAILGKCEVAIELKKLLSNPQVDQYIHWHITTILNMLEAQEENARASNEEDSMVFKLWWLYFNQQAHTMASSNTTGSLSDKRLAIEGLLTYLSSNQPIPWEEQIRILDALGYLADEETDVEVLSKLRQKHEERLREAETSSQLVENGTPVRSFDPDIFQQELTILDSIYRAMWQVNRRNKKFHKFNT